MALEVEGQAPRRGGRAVVAGVRFDARSGEVVALTGPDGAGKTTRLECVAGLRRSDAGRARHAGRATKDPLFAP